MARLFSPEYPKGQLFQIVVDAPQHLQNQLADPTMRQVMIYAPPEYVMPYKTSQEGWCGGKKREDLPVVIDLPPYTGSGLSRCAFKPFRESVTDIIDRLWGTKKIPPALFIFPDTYTRLGGTAFTPSKILGDQGAFIVENVLPAVQSYCDLSGKKGTFLIGKSSGGYGALHLVDRFPEIFQGVACHSGDIDFQLAFPPLLLDCAIHLNHYAGSIPTFLKEVSKKHALTQDDGHALLSLGLVAAFNSDLSFDSLSLPLDLKTGDFDKNRWNQFLKYDPLCFIPQHLDAFRKLEKFYLDVGLFDHYRLHFGAHKLHMLLDRERIEHVFETFEGTHYCIDHRLEVSLPYLLRTSGL